MVARMTALSMILLGSALMIAIASLGAFSFLLSSRRLQQLLNPLISLAAGSLLGGSLFHMYPEGLAALGCWFLGCSWLHILFGSGALSALASLAPNASASVGFPAVARTDRPSDSGGGCIA